MKKMKCWYKNSKPTLVLKPQKIERVWADPEIFMLRGAITDKQIEQVKEAAYPIVSQTNTVILLINQIKPF